MQVVSYSEARNSLKAVLDQVVNDADVTIINRRDAANAIGDVIRPLQQPHGNITPITKPCKCYPPSGINLTTKGW